MRITSKCVMAVIFAVAPAILRCAEPAGWELRDLKVVDPDGDCKCEVKKGAAEISVPGKAHDLSAEMGRMNAPRALCEVRGDFSVRVQTDCQLSPQTRSIVGRRAYQGASLVLMGDSANYVRLDRGAVFSETSDKIIRYANFERRVEFELDGTSPTDPGVHNSFDVADEKMRYLRLDRQGDKVTGYVSGDGVKWYYLGEKTIKLPTKVDVGVAVVNSSHEPVSVKFSEFGIAPQK